MMTRRKWSWIIGCSSEKASHPDFPNSINLNSVFLFIQTISTLSITGNTFHFCRSRNAKDAIQMRYAGILPGGGNIRGVPGLSIDDVFLYPNGTAAIWNCHTLLTVTIGSKSDLDTLKLLISSELRSSTNGVHNLILISNIYNDSYAFLGLV